MRTGIDSSRNWRLGGNGCAAEKAELKSIRGELHESLSRLRQRAAKCTDLDVQQFDKEVQKYAANLQKELDEAKSPNSDTSIADVATDLHMTGKAQKVFQIVMDTLADHFAEDPDAYYEIA